MALEDYALFILRVILGIIFIYHGFPKLTKARKVMLFNSKKFTLVLGFFETFSGLFIILGLLTQVAALILSLVMLGAIYNKILKWNIPFAAYDKLGWEFDLVLLAGNLVLFLLGAGVYSIDALL